MPTKSNAQKLLIKEGYLVLFIHPPENQSELLGELPSKITVVDDANSPVDFILAYIADRRELEKHLGELKKRLKPRGLMWIAYHKGTSKVKTDINRDTINGYAHTLGMEGIAMISLDDDWSALRIRISN
jgi:hypothetical protein